MAHILFLSECFLDGCIITITITITILLLSFLAGGFNFYFSQTLIVLEVEHIIKHLFSAISLHLIKMME